MPRSYRGEDFRWRTIWMKEILGRYQVDEVAAASRMASLGFRPHCHESVQENNSELYSVEFLC